MVTKMSIQSVIYDFLLTAIYSLAHNSSVRPIHEL
jgi:hypothetical protein